MRAGSSAKASGNSIEGTSAADNPTMRATAPLFQLDPGWPYVLAGLALFAAGVLIPAHNDLASLRAKLSRMRHEETIAYSRLKSYTDFIVALDEEDPVLVRRLAAAQLNLIPKGQRPVLQAASFNDPVKQWIESSVAAAPLSADELPRQSSLAQWAGGPNRLWLFAAAAMSVFVGLMLGPTAPPRRRESHAPARTRRAPMESISASTVVDLSVEFESVKPDPCGRTSVSVSPTEFPPACDSTDGVHETEPGLDDDARDEVAVVHGIRDNFDVPECNDARPMDALSDGKSGFCDIEGGEFSCDIDEAEDSINATGSDRRPAPSVEPGEAPEALDSVEWRVTWRDAFLT